MNEIWKPIKNFENYLISNFGNVMSLNYNRTSKSKLLSLNKDKNGYYQVSLYNENTKNKSFKIHKLVALHFPEICGEYFEGAVVDHIDANIHNNVATNLRFCTQKENINNPNYKRNPSYLYKHIVQIDKSGNIISTFSSISEAAIKTNTCRTNIHRVLNGSRKTAHGFIWKYI